MQNVYRLSDFAHARPLAPVHKISISDEALLKSIAAGSKSAMRVLFGRHNVRVYRFALRLAGNAALAEDIVGEVFLDVWRQANSFEGKSKVATWLLTIARYKVLSAMRRRSWELPLNEETTTAIVDPTADPEAAVCRSNRSDVIRRFLNRLSPAHREIIDLVYFHENSISEVAQIVGIPASTVKTRMYYARQHMAKLLKTVGIHGIGES
jgi:RNA polymerase sigma-70 factor, ECF subfamily